jgi:amidohydrolase
MHACTMVTSLYLWGGRNTFKWKRFKGTVKFIFQPAEEGAPLGEEGGASLMVEGALENKVDVILDCIWMP